MKILFSIICPGLSEIEIEICSLDSFQPPKVHNETILSNPSLLLLMMFSNFCNEMIQEVYR